MVTIFRARSSPSSRARCSISRTVAIASRLASSTTCVRKASLASDAVSPRSSRAPLGAASPSARAAPERARACGRDRQLLRAPVRGVDLAVDGLFLLCETFLLTLDLVAPGANVLLRRAGGLRSRPSLDERLTREPFGLALGLQDDLLSSALGALGLRPRDGSSDDEADRDAEDQRHDSHHHRNHRFTASFGDMQRPNRGPSGTVRPCVRRMRTRAMPGPAAPLALRSGVLPVSTGFSRFQARLNVDQRMNLVRREPTACVRYRQG